MTARLRKSSTFGKPAAPRAPVRVEPPAPSKGSSFNGTAAFAVVAVLFGAALLCLWRFGPSNGDSGSFLLVAGLLALGGGGYCVAQELDLLGDSDSDGASGGDGDGGGGGD